MSIPPLFSKSRMAQLVMAIPVAAVLLFLGRQYGPRPETDQVPGDRQNSVGQAIQENSLEGDTSVLLPLDLSLAAVGLQRRSSGSGCDTQQNAEFVAGVIKDRVQQGYRMLPDQVISSRHLPGLQKGIVWAAPLEAATMIGTVVQGPPRFIDVTVVRSSVGCRHFTQTLRIPRPRRGCPVLARSLVSRALTAVMSASTPSTSRRTTSGSGTRCT
jgi:hypothetical protein